MQYFAAMYHADACFIPNLEQVEPYLYWDLLIYNFHYFSSILDANIFLY